jgi:prophage antirepressor-like protein
MNALVPFIFEGHQIRVEPNDTGELWFVAKDVCAALAVGAESVRRLDDDEKGLRIVQTLGGAQEMSIVNESGLWALALTSRKEDAKRFRKWITSEVIPSIRKTGSYSLAAANSNNALAPLTPHEIGFRAMREALIAAGTRKTIAACIELNTIESTTGVSMELARKAIPHTTENVASLNAGAVGSKLGGLSAIKVNKLLVEHGLQFKNERKEWALTEAGKQHGECMDFHRGTHGGTQLLWRESVLPLLQQQIAGAA